VHHCLQVLIYEHSFVEYLKSSKFSCGLEKYRKKFEEKNLIAKGTYGIVCRAMDRKTNEIFAIKKIPFNGGLSDPVLKEIEIMYKLNCHLVCRLKSVFVEKNYLKNESNLSSVLNNEIFKTEKPFLLHIQMELCSMTLKEVMKKLNGELNQKRSEVMTPLGYYISSDLFKEILESVDYLHSQTVIHRDLKPSNILITDGMNGRFVKIADFGLATIHEYEGQSHTKYKGTVRYAAPEVMISSKYDTKADIYSLGVILQELFNICINEYLKYVKTSNTSTNIFFINYRPIGKGSQLENKYEKLFELSERMTASRVNIRPNCEKILSEKDFWSLDLSDLKIDYEPNSKKMKYCDNLFHSRFIEVKSRSGLE
jgi:serine/threonine protein kinase